MCINSWTVSLSKVIIYSHDTDAKQSQEPDSCVPLGIALKEKRNRKDENHNIQCHVEYVGENHR